MKHTFSFEKLDVWKNSKKLIIGIYNATAKFPSEEKFGLVSQIRRAGISVASNIAEGTSRKTNVDKAHFTTMSYASLMELLNQLIVSEELHYITKESYLELRLMITHISNQLNALRRYQLGGRNVE